MAKENKKRTFPTKYDESAEIGTFEVFMRPSMTEPDNAMSIPEIIARFTRGYGIEVEQRQWNTGSAFEGENPEEFFDDFGPAAQQQPAQQEPAQQQQQPAQQEPAQQQQQPAQQQPAQQEQQPAQSTQEGQ